MRPPHDADPADTSCRLAFIDWNRIHGRSAEISGALGGVAWSIHPRRLDGRRLAPARWSVCALITVWRLARHRPRSVIVQIPPIFPALIVQAYARLTGARVVIDAHPGAFGLKDDRLGRLALPLHRLLARRVHGTLVASPELADEVRRWGGSPEVLHEAPPASTATPPPRNSRPIVLFICTFSSDEPVGAVVEGLAGQGFDLRVTGDVPANWPHSELADVTYTGYLNGGDYLRALQDADVVLTLTTEPSSALRAAFDAVWAERPLVTSDWPLLRELFPYAVHVDNSAESIRAGVTGAVARRNTLYEQAPAARAAVERRWTVQLDRLRTRLQLTV